MKKLMMSSKNLFGEDTKTLIRIKVTNLIDDVDSHSRKELKLKLISLQNLLEEFD